MPPPADPIGTVGDLMRLAMMPAQMRRFSQQNEAEDIKLQQMRQGQKEAGLIQDALAQHGGDLEEALNTLRSWGGIGVSAAGKLQAQIKDQHRTVLDDQIKGLDLTQKRFSMAGQLIRGVEEAPEEQRAVAYSSVLPQVRETLGPELSKHVPEAYDPAWTSRALTWGETAKETLERRQAALAIARNKALDAKDVREADEYWTKALGLWLPTTESQDEWTQALTLAKGAGASAATLAKFGEAWTPEAAKRADTFAMTPAERARENKPPTPGSFEDYIGRIAKERNIKVGDLLTADIVKARARWNAASREPRIEPKRFIVRDGQTLWLPESAIQQGDLPVTGGQTLTANERANLKRWRATELAKIEADPMLMVYPAMKPDDREQVTTAKKAAVDRIESAYKDIVGDADTKHPAGGTPKHTVDDVKPLMTKGSGEYRLSDGSVWSQEPDGEIHKGPLKRKAKK